MPMVRDADTFLAEMKGEQTVHAVYAGIREFDSKGVRCLIRPDGATDQVNTHPCKLVVHVPEQRTGARLRVALQRVPG